MTRSVIYNATTQVKFELKKLGRVGGRVLVDYDSSLRSVEASKVNLDLLPIEGKVILFKEDDKKYSVGLYIKKSPGSFLRILLLQFKTGQNDPFYQTVKTLWENGQIGALFIERFSNDLRVFRRGAQPSG